MGETGFDIKLADLTRYSSGMLYLESLALGGEAGWWLERIPAGKRLGCVALPDNEFLREIEGQPQQFERGYLVKLCPLSPSNARIIRRALPWLSPVQLGLATSVGLGDRLGMATAGHVGSLQGRGIAPVFAQQSVRENARSGRTPQQVLDEAMWGVLQAGWRKPWGADADHLKATADIDAFHKAGYTFFTIDPGDYVDDQAAEATESKIAALPWENLEDSLVDLERRYLNRAFSVEGLKINFERETLWLAAVKYGRAVAFVAEMYRYLLQKVSPFELEVSVDETAQPTSPEEHFYIASELKRLGVRWVSLAPRFIGHFEKGVDYISPEGRYGEEGGLRPVMQAHAAIARALGPYKLSLHSGSDKFSIYPLAAEVTQGLVHLKTAGTSYLEALKVVANREPELFRELLDFCCKRYPADRASYHVSAEVDRVPDAREVPDGDLEALFDNFDVRQVLHVTFGSVLTAFDERGKPRFREHLMEILQDNEELYYDYLQRHFHRHLEPFTRCK